MKKYSIFFVFALIISLSILTSCESEDTPAPLYERIGGEPVVTAIIDQTITNIITDNRINFFFAALATNPSRAQALRTNLIDQLGELSGGSQQYKGRTMIASHTGLNITTAQFDAFIEDFTNAINSQNLSAAERLELIALYQNLKSEVAGR